MDEGKWSIRLGGGGNEYWLAACCVNGRGWVQSRLEVDFRGGLAEEETSIVSELRVS